MVPQTPQLRRQLCVIHATVFGAVQVFLATSSAQRVFMSKHDWVCPAGPPWPIRDAGVRPVAFSHASSSRVRIGLTPISALILSADAFIAASFCARPSSWASATHVPASRTNRPQSLRDLEAGCMSGCRGAGHATGRAPSCVQPPPCVTSGPRVDAPAQRCTVDCLACVLATGQPINARSTGYSLVPPRRQKVRVAAHTSITASPGSRITSTAVGIRAKDVRSILMASGAQG